jgi:hypothetical protein
MRKELRQRLANEYRYAANKMKEAPPERKMFYFSVLFGEAQRVLNFEWDRDLALLYTVSQQSYNLISAQGPMLGTVLSVTTSTIFEKLTQITADLATYYEGTENKVNKEEFYQILGALAEVTYAANGNGSFLVERGILKL